MTRTVVGWKLTDDETCAICYGAVATVLVTDDGVDSYPACDDCVRPGTTRDLVAEAFERGLRRGEDG